ncbi:macro domain-containing protein [Catellatospora bangladeshensis]|uniref:Macro domain-containing protein n=1 Tax=Catellatospora bangladeshensis TaxID=310355 RepID=A0A8J3JSH8_9ACTN|nr:macro domain-containing protein [Catellatospora bangladeshensis]GIF85883.1 hypothetical protein Cba03nite_72320 [Catellatospora bangladeshensis]
MPSDKLALGAAAVFMALCLATFLWATRPSAAGRRQAILVFTWLCAALAATLVIFSLFPNSHAYGDLMGVTLGGAGAFVVLVWTAALRASRRSEQIDLLQGQLRERDDEIARLTEEIRDLNTADHPRRLDSTQLLLYRVVGAPGRRCVGIVTGDIRRARCAEVWVNSENTDMQMARASDHSISGLIRYEGAVRDETGRIVDDVISDELDRRIGARRPVPAGTVVVTGSGALASVGVNWIAHVATVHGEPGAGFRQVQELGRCVTNVLTAVGSPQHDYAARSVLFPLLGVGHGSGDLLRTVTTMATVIAGQLATDRDSSVETVYLLAYTDAELLICSQVLGSMTELKAE